MLSPGIFKQVFEVESNVVSCLVEGYSFSRELEATSANDETDVIHVIDYDNIEASLKYVLEMINRKLQIEDLKLLDLISYILAYCLDIECANKTKPKYFLAYKDQDYIAVGIFFEISEHVLFKIRLRNEC